MPSKKKSFSNYSQSYATLRITYRRTIEQKQTFTKITSNEKNKTFTFSTPCE